MFRSTHILRALSRNTYHKRFAIVVMLVLAGVVSTGNGHQSIKRYFDVNPTNNTGMNAVVGFSYAPNELNGIPEANLLLQKSTNGGTTFGQLREFLLPSVVRRKCSMICKKFEAPPRLLSLFYGGHFAVR